MNALVAFAAELSIAWFTWQAVFAESRKAEIGGRNLDDKGITCWIPLHDVDVRNGCMQFIDGGHKDGVLAHHLVEGVASDLLTCPVDDSRAVV